jgi:hypothetical protein
VCRKRGASDGDNETHIDDNDDNNGGIEMQASKKPKTDSSSGSADSGGQDRLKVLQARVEKAESNMEEAKRDLDEAKAELARLKADINASKEDIQCAHDDVVRVDKCLTAAMETYKSAIDAETAAQTALAYNLANHIDNAFGQSLAFVRNQNALIHSKSHSISLSTQALLAYPAMMTSVTRIDRLVDADDVDDAQLLQVMDRWWRSLPAADANPDPQNEAIAVTQDLVVKVLANQEGDRVAEVQPVTSSLLQAYIKDVWAARYPWLRVYSERKIEGGSTLTSTTAPRRCDFAVFAAVDEPEMFDDRARASIVLAKDEKREKAKMNKTAARDEAVGQATQDFALIAARAVPGEQTPCMFALSGPPSEFDLCEVHIVKNHPLAATATSSAAESPFLEAIPLTIKSNFQLPAPFQTSGAMLAGAFRPFSGQHAPPFPDGPCQIQFEAVVAVTPRRFLLKARVGNSELVLKISRDVSSIERERGRTGRICALFAGSLSAHCERVRLPIGYFGNRKPIIVSKVWAGRSLNRGWPRNDCREKVRNLLTSQIWPLIDAMANEGAFYVDLHAGNVMVDEQLENAWLIDFEGAIGVDGKPSSPTRALAEPVDETGLRAAIAEQKKTLLKLLRGCDSCSWQRIQASHSKLLELRLNKSSVQMFKI